MKLAPNPSIDEVVFTEERAFLKSQGWTDPRIAARFGMTWDWYCIYIRKHPGWAPAVDPEIVARQRFDALLGSTALGRRKSKKKENDTCPRST